MRNGFWREGAILAGWFLLALTLRLAVVAMTGVINRDGVQYTAFALSVPERVRFRVWLDPFEDTWHDNGFERSVSYTSLAPGEYTVRVELRGATPREGHFEIPADGVVRVSLRAAP